ncbi:MAG: hypothetical protein M1828_006321 [Chrysothrix sp. TS-e1954]|nr:MAG: hypothetical protein M1828_006321 [Chrysothrix sp. TS-e1954]
MRLDSEDEPDKEDPKQYHHDLDTDAALARWDRLALLRPHPKQAVDPSKSLVQSFEPSSLGYETLSDWPLNEWPMEQAFDPAVYSSMLSNHNANVSDLEFQAIQMSHTGVPECTTEPALSTPGGKGRLRGIHTTFPDYQLSLDIWPPRGNGMVSNECASNDKISGGPDFTVQQTTPPATLLTGSKSQQRSTTRAGGLEDSLAHENHKRKRHLTDEGNRSRPKQTRIYQNLVNNHPELIDGLPQWMQDGFLEALQQIKTITSVAQDRSACSESDVLLWMLLKTEAQSKPEVRRPSPPEPRTIDIDGYLNSSPLSLDMRAYVQECRSRQCRRTSRRDTGKYECVRCEAKFDDFVAFKRHWLQLDPQDLFKCPCCLDQPRIFHLEYKLREHLRDARSGHGFVNEDRIATMTRACEKHTLLFNQECGFCDEIYEDFGDFFKHVCDHFVGRLPGGRKTAKDWHSEQRTSKASRVAELSPGGETSDDDDTSKNDLKTDHHVRGKTEICWNNQQSAATSSQERSCEAVNANDNLNSTDLWRDDANQNYRRHTGPGPEHTFRSSASSHELETYKAASLTYGSKDDSHHDYMAHLSDVEHTAMGAWLSSKTSKHGGYYKQMDSSLKRASSNIRQGKRCTPRDIPYDPLADPWRFAKVPAVTDPY